MRGRRKKFQSMAWRFIPPEHRDNSKYTISQTNSSVTYNYTILPLRAGRFTIPPQTVHAGGKILRTPELALNVADCARSTQTTRPSRGTQSQSTNAGDLVFAELIVPKKTAYVGEIVPVQIRMGFDPRVHPRLTEPPEITGQGFTAQKLQQSVTKFGDHQWQTLRSSDI